MTTKGSLNGERWRRRFLGTEGCVRASGVVLVLVLVCLGVGACSSDGGGDALGDTEGPTISAQSPSNRQTNVPVGVAVEVTFQEPLDPATLTASTVRLRSGKTFYAGTVSYSGTTVVFKSNGNLENGALHTVHLTTDITDTAGNHLPADYFWTFTTEPAPDVTPPTVVSTTPNTGGIGFRVNGIIRARFSEPVDPNTVSTGTFLLTQGATTIPGVVSYDPSSLTASFNPDTDLSNDTSYTARITTGVTDLAAVPNSLASDKTWTFKTQTVPDTDPPSVVSTNPAADAIALPLNNVVTARFSETIDPLTVTNATFTITLEGGGTAVTGTVDYDQNSLTAAFRPAAPLPIGKRYTARLVGGSGGVTDCSGVPECDQGGNPMAADYVWTFTAPAPRFAYVANFASNSLSLMTINATTGGLTLDSTLGVSVEGTPRELVVDPTMRFLYAFSDTSSGAGRVDSYAINQSTGALTSIGTVETGALHRSIAVDPKGRFFYVVDSQAVTPYRIDPTTGVLISTRTPETSLRELASIAVHPNGLFAYVVGRPKTNVPIGNSSRFVIKRFLIDQNTGVLTSEQTDDQLVDTETLPSTVVVDPSGRFLYTLHLGVTDLLAFSIAETTGTLTPVGTIDAGGAQRGIALDPLGQFVYVSSLALPGSFTPGVSTLRIDQVSGALSTVAAIAAGSYPTAVAVDPSAQFAYVVNRDSNDVSIFRITRTGGQAGALVQVTGTPNPVSTDGGQPVAIAIHGGVIP